MEFSDIDKKNIKKLYKKYGEKLVSKIVKKQDKLKMSESLRSTMRKMRKQEGGNPDCGICDSANEILRKLISRMSMIVMILKMMMKESFIYTIKLSFQIQMNYEKEPRKDQ